MSLTLTLNLPPDVERRLRTESADLEAEAEEAFAVQLFRRGKLDHVQLSRTLKLDRFETDSLLQQYGVEERTLTLEEVEEDARNARQFLVQGES